MIPDPSENKSARSYVSYEAHYRSSDADEIAQIKADFARVRNAWGLDRTETINRLLLGAIEKALTEIEQTTGDPIEKEQLHRQRLISQKLRQLGEIRSEVERLCKIADQMGIEEFEDWCQQTEVDYVEFCAKRDRLKGRQKTETQPQRTKKTSVMFGFLIGYHHDGQQKSIDQVRQAAEKLGIVKSEADWHNLQQVAYDKRFSGTAPRGFWQLPEGFPENVTSQGDGDN